MESRTEIQTNLAYQKNLRSILMDHEQMRQSCITNLNGRFQQLWVERGQHMERHKFRGVLHQDTRFQEHYQNFLENKSSRIKVIYKLQRVKTYLKHLHNLRNRMDKTQY